jgi:hypothetical protein
LLERRPDVREAEELLRSANAEIGVAKADYFPRISLTGFVRLGESPTGQIALRTADRLVGGGNIVQPIFTGGRIKGNVQAAKARWVQSANFYLGTVQTSFGEVSDALAGIRFFGQISEQRDLQVKALDEGSELTRSQLCRGPIELSGGAGRGSQAVHVPKPRRWEPGSIMPGPTSPSIAHWAGAGRFRIQLQQPIRPRRSKTFGPGLLPDSKERHPVAKIPEKMKDVIREARRFAKKFRVSDGKKFRLDDFDRAKPSGWARKTNREPRKFWPPVSRHSPSCRGCCMPRTGGPSC